MYHPWYPPPLCAAVSSRWAEPKEGEKQNRTLVSAQGRRNTKQDTANTANRGQSQESGAGPQPTVVVGCSLPTVDNFILE